MTKLTLREEWEARVADFRASGKTAKAWCDEHQLKLHQLWYWVRKIESTRLSKSSGKALSPQWVRLPMEGPSSHDVLTLKVGNVALEVRPGFDPALLADVIKVLKAL